MSDQPSWWEKLDAIGRKIREEEEAQNLAEGLPPEACRSCKSVHSGDAKCFNCVAWACAPSRRWCGCFACWLCEGRGRKCHHRPEDVIAAARTELPAALRRIDALEAALVDILDYRGGADSALDDEYVVGRARAALAASKGGV